MPRSPSPPQRYPPRGGYDRYRSPSPPPRNRYPPDRSRPVFQDRPFRRAPRPHERDRDGFDRNANRTWDNYRASGRSTGRDHDTYDGRDRSPYRGGRSRSRDREGGPSKPREPDSGYPQRRESPVRSRPSGSVTPEEGQITSPAISRRAVSPQRDRSFQRSVSPGYRRYDREADDRSRPGGGGWRRDGPGERRGFGQPPWERNPRYPQIDSDFPRSRRVYDSPRGRSRSRSSGSSYTHSRRSSPVKREPSPSRSDRNMSPRSRPEVTERKPDAPEPGEARFAAPAPAPSAPVDRKPFLNRLPPSGPRSDRLPPPGVIPTGPRGYNAPIAPVIPSGPRGHAPSMSRQPLSSAPTAPPPPATPPQAVVSMPTAGSSPSVERSPRTSPNASVAPPTGPRSAWSHAPRRSLSPKPELQDVQLQVNTVQVKLEVSSPKHEYTTDVAAVVKREDIQDPAIEAQIHAPRWAESKQPTEQELQEMKAKEIESRIMAELPPPRGSYGLAKWERELAQHWIYATTLQHQTLRAQSAARMAGAVLADAEAERIAAAERRQVAEAHLASSALGVGSMIAASGI